MQYLADRDNAMAHAHVICAVETHLKASRLVQEVKSLDKIGYRAVMEEAVVPTDGGRGGPGHGGVAVMARKNLSSQPLTKVQKRSLQLEEHKGLGTQWAATTVRLEGMDLVVATIYLAPDLGLAGSNWTTIQELAEYLHHKGSPFVVVGDFNNEVHEMEPAGLTRYLKAV